MNSVNEGWGVLLLLLLFVFLCYYQHSTIDSRDTSNLESQLYKVRVCIATCLTVLLSPNPQRR
jgi:hypothetical protein